MLKFHSVAGNLERRLFSTVAQGGKKLKNNDIKYPKLRVVYKDDNTGKSLWKLMARDEAIKFASARSLDLVLVDGTADPPVCKLDDFGKLMMEQKKKEKLKAMKAKVLKEMVIGSGIDPNDLSHKTNKVKDFLENGHPVKVTVAAKKKQFAANPLILDETVLKVLELVENSVSTVQQLPLRGTSKDLLLNPKAQSV